MPIAVSLRPRDNPDTMYVPGLHAGPRQGGALGGLAQLSDLSHPPAPRPVLLLFPPLVRLVESILFQLTMPAPSSRSPTSCFVVLNQLQLPNPTHDTLLLTPDLDVKNSPAVVKGSLALRRKRVSHHLDALPNQNPNITPNVPLIGGGSQLRYPHVG